MCGEERGADGDGDGDDWDQGARRTVDRSDGAGGEEMDTAIGAVDTVLRVEEADLAMLNMDTTMRDGGEEEVGIELVPESPLRSAGMVEAVSTALRDGGGRGDGEVDFVPDSPLAPRGPVAIRAGERILRSQREGRWVGWGRGGEGGSAEDKGTEGLNEGG